MTRARTLGLIPDEQEVILPGTAPKTGQVMVVDTYVTGPAQLKWDDAAKPITAASATALGGVKLPAAPPTPGQFVSNILPDGTVQFSTAPSANLPAASASGQVLVSSVGPSFSWGAEYLDEGVY